MAFAVPRIGTAMAAIFVATIPLFSMVIGQIWGVEHITTQGRLGLALGFVGICVLVGFPTTAFTSDFILGCAASIVAASGAAFGSNYARKFLQGIDSWTQTIGAFLFGGLWTLPLLTLVPVPTTPQLSDFGYLVLLAVTMSSICYVLYFRMVSELGPTKAISVEFVVTVIAVILGAVVLHERLSVLQIVGSAIIIGGCLLVLDLVPHHSKASQKESR
jgi:drug/metabolite transporter (DMT)-like permease